MERIVALLERIPHTLIALLGRFSIAAVFWKSGQTKVEGLVLDPVAGDWQFGWPRLAESTIPLFQEEYALPLIPPDITASAAATAEHVLSLMLLAGLGTRFAALGLLVMTMTIQLFVYPAAYPTHGAWATVLLYLLARGPGRYSLDHWLSSRSLSSASPGRVA
jgi:putative oxidoreductase